MFEYNYNPNAKALHVHLPRLLRYDFSFMNEMTVFIKRVLDEDVSLVLLSCAKGAEYEKISRAYIYNVLLSLISSKSVGWTEELARYIGDARIKDGHKFHPINEYEAMKGSNLENYKFEQNEDVEAAVNELTRILVEKNLTIDTEKVKEFLSTMIGEIFSNSFIHSAQDEVFLVYDILYQDGSYYLCVNIIDFGTTIVSNVKEYLQKKNHILIDNLQCIEWAIKKGNTTREKSGGYGLSTLISYIESTKGELYIFSGNVYLKVSDEGQVTDYAHGFFNGTSVTFKVKLYDLERAILYDTKKEELVSIGLDSI